MIRRALVLLALLLIVAACEQPSLVLPSGVSTSFDDGDHEGTPGPLESIPPLEEASAACATLALVDQVLEVPGESPRSPARVEPGVLALQVGTLSEDLHQVALETPGAVAQRIDAISVALAKDKAAMLAGKAPPRRVGRRLRVAAHGLRGPLLRIRLGPARPLHRDRRSRLTRPRPANHRCPGA